jgi:hypothetical protein
MSRVFSYVMVRDYGFAPNPFHGFCTLATCKPVIRKTAQPGDYVIGMGSASQGRAGQLVYVMRVEETLTFQGYWADTRFLVKRPNLSGSRKQWYGDNIYQKPDDKNWKQADSHHSKPRGVINVENLRSDTSTNRVLISRDFVYWGSTGPNMPERFRDWNGANLVHRGVGHSCNFPPDLVRAFSDWVDPHLRSGRQGRPHDWE